ncbi:MAG: hypothetical protein H0W86_05300 [Armatimonadetes bacterium]|nr:hypothetical protein [Armatimonadota bacterium]
MGILSKADADKYSPEGKDAPSTTDEDFPPDIVKALKEGVDFAVASPVPEAEEGSKWVFAEGSL